ncbi:MAG: hypothetical protein CLLPBCKN_001375 [Chroococcidiopsis cubana SAG 39.79]|uniref:Uncharacterized protein n=1 Tax=Chroococcidiopsis cubana SAG 39.79 TaxID=388085 RepID=A0AB37UCY0_9CYAN|nr:hypothetical protein [Chroococcidiopsis cubana]MDZ4871987.1 hypothetical protein [Chroococcidiopsis cubana SAG 39.79]PSB61968.1 hypothetical protein C7B79_19915 [Chroococcidiopsis cubana CCALA 043]RUT06349.1 hypothetical protein DSM107010_52940 [Chroococcidiopsis cubana SAG 39.79]
MNVLEQQRALLPKHLQDKFEYCPVTDEENAVREVANWMYRAKKYLKRPFGDDIEADKAEIEWRERICHEAQMALPPMVRGWDFWYGEKALELLMGEIEKPTSP